MTGKVFLIGPGDPDLITLKAIRALRAANVILLDDLANRELLQHAPQARVVEASKRGGCKSTPQHLINCLMVALAEQRHVISTLEALPMAVKQKAFASPAIIVVGDVARLAEHENLIGDLAAAA